MIEGTPVVRRKILLKNQAIRLLRKEKNDLRRKLLLLDLKDSYKRQMAEEFDPTLSFKIDCILFLLES